MKIPLILFNDLQFFRKLFVHVFPKLFQFTRVTYPHKSFFWCHTRSVPALNTGYHSLLRNVIGWQRWYGFWLASDDLTYISNFPPFLLNIRLSLLSDAFVKKQLGNMNLKSCFKPICKQIFRTLIQKVFYAGESLSELFYFFLKVVSHNSLWVFPNLCLPEPDAHRFAI